MARCPLRLAGLFAAAAALLAGCGTSPGADATGTAVVLTNRSARQLQVLVGATPASGGDALQWIVPLTPHSWNSVVLPCEIDRLVHIGTLVLSDVADTAPLELSGVVSTLKSGRDFECGDVIGLAFDDATIDPARRPVTARLQPYRRALGAPAPTNGGDEFLVLKAEGPAGLAVAVNVSWEDNAARVYTTTVTLSGRETNFGFLLRCPTVRVGNGDLNDANSPGALLSEANTPLPPAGSLVPHCGQIVTVRVSAAADAPAGYAVAIAAEDAGATDLGQFGNVYLLLTGDNLLDSPSNQLGLLPPPAVP